MVDALYVCVEKYQILSLICPYKEYVSFLQENNVPSNEERGGDVDNIAMLEVANILKDKLPNANGLIGHSILFKATHGDGEEEVKFEKRISRKSKPQKKRHPKKRK